MLLAWGLWFTSLEGLSIPDEAATDILKNGYIFILMAKFHNATSNFGQQISKKNNYVFILMAQFHNVPSNFGNLVSGETGIGRYRNPQLGSEKWEKQFGVEFLV